MKDPLFIVGIFFLIIFGVLVLSSIAPFLFPLYFVYIVLGTLAFVFFARLDFDILLVFNKYFYIFSIIFLILPLIIGQVTRGTVRWIQIGPLTIQPAEIVRPFILLFFARFLYEKELNLKRIVKSLILLFFPLLLILVQPSLGVTILTAIGFLGVLVASSIDKKRMLVFFLMTLTILPLGWFVLAPYQKERIATFLSPEKDPYGSGYNSIQSVIAVGSGKLTGRGLGEGVQTQLSFLPERHTDFIFASISEELGFLGASLILLGVFFVLFRITKIAEDSKGPEARAFTSGIFLTFLVQSLIHVGMNMGIMPVTGLPLPLVSAGGSSFLATMMALGMVYAAKKK